MLKTKDLYDLSHTRAASLLENTEYPWEDLPKIKELILEIGPMLPKDEYDEVSEKVSAISPVPGGVGGVTSAVLASHVVRAAKRQSGR